jgi:hypothetical protein
VSLNKLTLWRQNPRVHRRIHKSPTPIPILSQLNPLRTPPDNLPMIHSDPILASTLQSSEWSLSFGHFHKNLVTFLFSPMRATCTVHRNMNTQQVSMPREAQSAGFSSPFTCYHRSQGLLVLPPRDVPRRFFTYPVSYVSDHKRAVRPKRPKFKRLRRSNVLIFSRESLPLLLLPILCREGSEGAGKQCVLRIITMTETLAELLISEVKS